MLAQTLDSNVLVLNKYFQAVQITSVRRAFGLFYTGRAKAVDEAYSTYTFTDWLGLPPNGDMVRTPLHSLRIPRVVQLIHYDKIPQFKIRFTRKNIFLRDRYTCQYCGEKHDEKDLTIDHVIPSSRDGGNTWENVVSCCFSCNNRKGNEKPNQAGMRLIRTPKRPRWIPFSRFSKQHSSHPLWKVFTDIAYCTIPTDDD